MRMEAAMTEEELYDYTHTPGQEKRRKEFYAEDERCRIEAEKPPPTPENPPNQSTVSEWYRIRWGKFVC